MLFSIWEILGNICPGTNWNSKSICLETSEDPCDVCKNQQHSTTTSSGFPHNMIKSILKFKSHIVSSSLGEGLDIRAPKQAQHQSDKHLTGEACYAWICMYTPHEPDKNNSEKNVNI